MSDPEPSSGRKPLTPSRLLTFSCFGLLVSFGLCGLGSSFQRDFSFLTVSGIALFAASLFGLAAGIVWGILQAILGRKQT